MRWPLLERRHMKKKNLLKCSLFFLMLFAGGNKVMAQDIAEDSVSQIAENLVTSLPLDPSYAEECSEQGKVETLNYTCHSYALEAVDGESDIGGTSDRWA